jgi:hypothetical protein
MTNKKDFRFYAIVFYKNLYQILDQSDMGTDQPTDGQTDGPTVQRTKSLIKALARAYKFNL